MDSGLARFAVLIVLFFLLTGDLAGMVKHMFEEAGYGGKQHNNQHHRHQQQRNRQQSPEKSAGEGFARSAKPPVAAAGPDDIGGDGPTADDDPDMEAFGEQSWVEVKTNKYQTEKR